MDVTSALPGISRLEFLQNLADSHQVSAADIDRLAADRPDADALALAHALLTAGALTEYQLTAIFDGRQTALRVGNYDILDRLGAGGMGTVFKARHRRMKRIVALKVLSGELCKDVAFVQRFQREVETIARLGHPNVVMAYDADETDIGHFLVMELVDGRDLASLVAKRGPFEVPEAVEAILQAARLAYAHAQGIIHRDVKPHNLLRDPAGTVKVTDLGLARLANQGGDPVSSLTQAGSVLGTVDYMPPEQATDSTTTDHRADIYSLGCTLHFLLSGSPPYAGASMMAILLKHRDGSIPSLRAARPEVPTALDELFHRMVAKKPADRVQMMDEVIATLEQIAAGFAGRPLVSSSPAGPAQPLPGSPTVVAPATAPLSETVVQAPATTSVLIVEPSRVQAGIIRKYLEGQNVAVSAAVSNGNDALNAVRDRRPTGIVSSFHLADMTGIELAQRVRTEFKDRPPGFVLITSTLSSGEDTGLSRLDRVVLLNKPFTPEQLVQALNVVTGKPPPGEAAAPAKPRVERSRLRVLIVDDAAAARANERATLQRLGVTQFVEVADGAQAIAAAARDTFDLFVTDYNMPLMDGRALVSYLKQTPATASIPIIMVTSETDQTLLEPVRKLGVAAIFDKAFPEFAVGRLLDELFSTRGPLAKRP